MGYEPIKHRLDYNYAAPAKSWRDITKSDSVDLPHGMCRAIYVGVSGHIAVQGEDGTSVTFYNAAAGSILALQAKRVLSTGTTATNLVALY
jgi:hypothetical protein